jgi:hypothetical protein
MAEGKARAEINVENRLKSYQKQNKYGPDVVRTWFHWFRPELEVFDFTDQAIAQAPGNKLLFDVNRQFS